MAFNLARLLAPASAAWVLAQGFAQHSQARPARQTESSSRFDSHWNRGVTDQKFTSGSSPPRLAATQ